MGQKQGKVDVGEGQISKMEAAQKAQAEQDRQGGKHSRGSNSSGSGQQGLSSTGSQKQMRPTDSFRRYQVAKDDEDDDDGDEVVYGDPQSGGAGGGGDDSTAGYANIGDFKQDYSGMGRRRRPKQPETHTMDPELAGLRDTLKKKSSSGAMKPKKGRIYIGQVQQLPGNMISGQDAAEDSESGLDSPAPNQRGAQHSAARAAGGDTEAVPPRGVSGVGGLHMDLAGGGGGGSMRAKRPSGSAMDNERVEWQ